MTITTGTIELKGTTNTSSIAFEVEGSVTGTISLVTMSNNASPTVGSLPTGMRDFAGHTQGSIPSAPGKVNTLQDFIGIYASWFDTSSDETGFKIQWSINGGGFTNEQTVGANVTSVYFSLQCVAGDTYACRVKSYNGAGDSAWTTDLSAVLADDRCII